MHAPNHSLARTLAASLLCCFALLGAVPVFASAAPAQTVHAEVIQPSPSVAPGESVRMSVTVSVTEPAEYLEVRVRLRNPQGTLVFQKTEVRSGLAAGRHVVAFERDAAAARLEQGRYPLEVRVLATGSVQTLLTDRVLVVDPASDPVPVLLVACVEGTPLVGRDGSFATDPAADARLMDDLAFLTGLAQTRGRQIALALPPILIEELGRTAAGYSVADGTQVGAGSGPAMRAEAMLETLRASTGRGDIALLDVPYALPDLAGLESIGASDDLAAHWARADSVSMATLHSVTTSSTAFMGPSLTAPSVLSLEARQTTQVIAPADALTAEETTPAPGVYRLAGTDITALVPDEDAAASLATGAGDFYDALFDRIGSGPVVIVIRVGPGSQHHAIEAQHALDWIAAAPWLSVRRLEGATADQDAPSVSVTPQPRSTAPAGYWAEVAAARDSVVAYANAAGQSDPDTEATSRALLAAESVLWAGCDGGWGGAAAGLELARQAREYVRSQFELVYFDAKDVTLSGSTGEVPLTLINNTGKTLMLSLHGEPDAPRSAPSAAQIEVQPTQNFVTVPVDLYNIASTNLTVSVRAGDITVAETVVHVRTSYIDRLATVGLVVLVLIVLLAIIYRRVRPAIAATIGDDRDSTGS